MGTEGVGEKNEKGNSRVRGQTGAGEKMETGRSQDCQDGLGMEKDYEREKGQEELMDRYEEIVKEGKGRRKLEASRELQKTQRTYCISRKVSRCWIRFKSEDLEWIPVSAMRLRALLLTLWSLSINPWARGMAKR